MTDLPSPRPSLRCLPPSFPPSLPSLGRLATVNLSYNLSYTNNNRSVYIQQVRPDRSTEAVPLPQVSTSAQHTEREHLQNTLMPDSTGEPDSHTKL